MADAKKSFKVGFLLAAAKQGLSPEELSEVLTMREKTAAGFFDAPARLVSAGVGAAIPLYAAMGILPYVLTRKGTSVLKNMNDKVQSSGILPEEVRQNDLTQAYLQQAEMIRRRTQQRRKEEDEASKPSVRRLI